MMALRMDFRRRATMVLVIQGLPLLGLAAGVWLFLREGIRPLDAGLFAAMYLLTMAGVELGLHRYFAHRSFETTRPIRAVLLALGCMAGQGSALLWSAVHRVHHATSDREGDPHSPVLGREGFWQRIRGFLWAQLFWFIDTPAVGRFPPALAAAAADPPALARSEDPELRRYARTIPDWLADRDLVRLDLRYWAFVALGFLLPTAVGLLATGTAAGALRALVWGGFVRYWVVQQVTFAINSVGHTVGIPSGLAPDLSRNNAVMALLTLGSGWHSNHHASPASATLRFRPWQLDPAYGVICALEALGLAWDVRRAPLTPAQDAPREA